MTDGKEIRQAFDGPEVEHDELIDSIEARNREDRVRATSAGESRQKIGAYLEETGLNSKAYSWMRSTLKLLDREDGQDKAMDVIRSLEKVLPMVKNHVSGQSTAEMDFGGDDNIPGESQERSTFESDETRDFDAAVDEVVKPINFGAA